MTRHITYTRRVEFGDCDPAGIVWFPNFFKWHDAASRHFFIECGVPPWRETEKTMGIIGTPVVDTHARFVKTATYGDLLHVDTHIAQWRGKSFVLHYRITRGDDLIMECDEVRVFLGRQENGDFKAVEIPQAIRQLCE